jgi:hypothetical protein
MDPWIQIRIHTKMSWISNAGFGSWLNWFVEDGNKGRVVVCDGFNANKFENFSECTTFSCGFVTFAFSDYSKIVLIFSFVIAIYYAGIIIPVSYSFRYKMVRNFVV